MTESRKIVSIEEAATLALNARQTGGTVVMCHGCFDIVHPGHIRHLQQAAKLGDHLLVTITCDQDLGKGEARPLIPQELRAEGLAALDCVRWVAINHHPTAAEALRVLCPDVYVKGREYEHNRDQRFREEREIVEAAGGRVVFTSGDVIFSSSALIDSLEERGTPFHAARHQLVEAHGITPESVDRLVASFHGASVLVIGETILDTYVMCDRPSVASEGPMMTLRPIESREYDGGAAIIALHLAAMGARPTLLTALPRSVEADALRERLGVAGVEVRSIECPDSLFRKDRFLVGASKIMKLDHGEPLALGPDEQQSLIDLAVEIADSMDGAIIADYGLGLFTSTMMTSMCNALRPLVKVLTGDISGRRSNLLGMQGLDLVCPSEVEMRGALHDYDQGLSAVAWRLLHDTNSRAAIVTLGEEGLIAFDRPADSAEVNAERGTRLRAEHVPALTTSALDQLGCGDALLAAATLVLISGGTPAMGGIVGALAAATAAQKLGNAIIGAADLRRGVRRFVHAKLTFETEPKALRSRSSRDQLSPTHL